MLMLLTLVNLRAIPQSKQLKSGYSMGDGATFIPKKAAQWHMKPKKFGFLDDLL